MTRAQLIAVVGPSHAAGIGLSVVILGRHRPSDVAASSLACGAGSCAAALALRASDGRPSLDLRGLAWSSRLVVALADGIRVLSLALFAAYAPLGGGRRA